jgi:hypothetical protein
MVDSGDFLLPGERLLWAGRPAKAVVVPTDLVWPALIAASLIAGIAAHGPGQSKSFGYTLIAEQAVLACIAIALAVRALHVRPKALIRVVYQVTDRRVLVITTGQPDRRRVWAAYLDQLPEPAVKPRRDGTADLFLRPQQTLLSAVQGLMTRQEMLPGLVSGRPRAFPVLRALPDAERVRQEIAAGRDRMLRGLLDVPPAFPLPAGMPPPDVRLIPGERVLWSGRPETIPWWFGGGDIAVSAVLFAFVLFAIPADMWAHGTNAPPIILAAIPCMVIAVFGYPAVGRLLVRRLRIKRSVYVLTSMRLITIWAARSRAGQFAGTTAPLSRLLPPEVSGGTILMNPAWPVPGGRASWAELLWPAATTKPPQLVGVPEPGAVAGTICAAQLAERARTWQLGGFGHR